MKKYYSVLVINLMFLSLVQAQWSTSGSNIYNTNTGNVGIGTSSPNYRLDAETTAPGKAAYFQTSGSWQAIDFSSDGGTTKGSLSAVGGLLNIGSSASGTNSFMNINLSNGNVGIGTSNPLYKTVISNNGANGIELDPTGIQLAGGVGIQAYNRSTSSYIPIQIYGSKLIFGGGNVGIGTQGPSAKLHIAGSGSNINAGNNDVISGDLVVQSNTGGRSMTSGAALEFVIPANTDGSGSWGQARIITVAGNTNSANATGKLILGTRRYWQKPGTSTTEWFYGDDLIIDGGGNVGIGIGANTLDAKLAVKGQVHAQEVKVDLNGAVAPDYVFEKDYQLTSLEEIKNYIDQNKHLPEVPSAKEMEKNGVQLGEMNMLLLKKIEELTLYVIDIKNENTYQRNLITTQQKEIEELKTIVKKGN